MNRERQLIAEHRHQDGVETASASCQQLVRLRFQLQVSVSDAVSSVGGKRRQQVIRLELRDQLCCVDFGQQHVECENLAAGGLRWCHSQVIVLHEALQQPAVNVSPRCSSTVPVERL